MILLLMFSPDSYLTPQLIIRKDYDMNKTIFRNNCKAGVPNLVQSAIYSLMQIFHVP